MKCLVTGAAGFIGHHLVAQLLEEGHVVLGVDNLSTGTKDRLIENEKNGLRFIYKDLAVKEDQEEIMKALEGEPLDVIFHTAALPRVPVSFERPHDVLTNNIESTIFALEIARLKGARMVYSSSSSIYGTQKQLPLHEGMAAKPESPYALSKWIGEELCHQYRDDFDVQSVALRYFNVFGPGMARGGYATAVRIFLDQAKNGKALTITGDGEQERDFTHVSDVVRANIQAMEQIFAEEEKLEHEDRLTLPLGLREVTGAFNIGSGAPKKIMYVATCISTNITHIAKRKEPKKTHADRERALKVLGWEPKVKFYDGLKPLIENNNV